jgi:hypothetical protein
MCGSHGLLRDITAQVCAANTIRTSASTADTVSFLPEVQGVGTVRSSTS